MGGMLAPLLAGRLADQFSLTSPLVLMTICALTASLLACFLMETSPGKQLFLKKQADLS